MRDFNDKSRFTVRSLPEIFADISVVVAKLKARRAGLDGRMSREVVLNSLFCYYSALTLDEQIAIFDQGLERMMPLLQAPDPLAGDQPSAPVRVDVEVVDATPPPPPSRAKRRG